MMGVECGSPLVHIRNRIPASATTCSESMGCQRVTHKDMHHHTAKTPCAFVQATRADVDGGLFARFPPAITVSVFIAGDAQQQGGWGPGPVHGSE